MVAPVASCIMGDKESYSLITSFSLRLRVHRIASIGLTVSNRQFIHMKAF